MLRISQPETVPPDSDPVGTALGSGSLQKKLLSFAMRVVKAPNFTLRSQMAEELVSEAMLRMLERKADYDPTRGTVQAWGHGFINTLSRQRLRKAEIQRRRHVGDEELKKACSSELLPHSHAVACEEWNRVLTAVDRFSTKERELFELRHREGRSSIEIATKLKQSHANIRVMLNRLKGKIVLELGLDTEVRS